MKAILLAVITGAVVAAPAAELPTLKFAGGAADLQALLDKAPEGTVVMCEQTGPLTVTKTLTIAKPIALRGLKARLPENLGDTVLLVVAAKGVTLTDLELHGNYDSVPQKSRAPLIHIKAGEFQVERCKFFDGSKDGIMVTPDDGTGDIVGGVVRNIEGTRMGRDVVSLSGGCGGQRIRNVTVENIRLKKGYYRGAVEVSDGSDNVTVRHVHAEDAVYAIDVQDHGARQPGKPAPSAPNTNITLEDVTAVNCKHILRTANHDLGHSHLTLRDFTGRDCQEPVLISNTKHVRLENLTLSNDPAAKKPRITLRNCEDVQLRNVTIVGLREGREAVATPNSTDVRIEGLKRSNTEAPAKVAQPSFPAIEASMELRVVLEKASYRSTRRLSATYTFSVQERVKGSPPVPSVPLQDGGKRDSPVSLLLFQGSDIDDRGHDSVERLNSYFEASRTNTLPEEGPMTILNTNAVTLKVFDSVWLFHDERGRVVAVSTTPAREWVSRKVIEQFDPATGRPPIRSETNRTSSAAGSRR